MVGWMQKHRRTRWLGGLFVVLSFVAPLVAQAAVVTVPLTFEYSEIGGPQYTTTVATYDAAGCREGAMRRCEDKRYCWTGNDVYALWHFSIGGNGANGDTCYWRNESSSGWVGSIRFVCAFQDYSGFRYNLNNKTCERDVPDTLTITLSGGTEVEPSKGSDIKTLPIIATVIDQSTKKPPTNQVKVHVSLTVDPKTGGHDHGDSTRPRGGIAEVETCATDSECWPGPQSTGSKGMTDGNGQVVFNFNAPEASGTHTISATCDGCSNTATKPVDVKVSDLWPIPGSVYYALTEDGSSKVIGSTTNHTSNHYLTTAASMKLWRLAADFYNDQIQN